MSVKGDGAVHKPYQGVWNMVLAALMFALLGFFIKSIPSGLSSLEIVFLRNVCTLFIIFPFFLVAPSKVPSEGNLKWYAVKIFSGLMAMYCYYYALQTLPLSLAVLLNNTAPLFIPIVVVLLMKKFCSRRTVMYMLGGFLGVVVILFNDDMSLMNTSILIGLLAGFFLAVSQVSVSAIGCVGNPINIMFYFMLSTTIVSFIILGFHCSLPNFEQGFFLLAAGVVTAVGGWASAQAFLVGLPNKLAALNYLTVPFAFICGVVFLKESVSVQFILGSLMVLFFSVLNLLDTKTKEQCYD